MRISYVSDLHLDTGGTCDTPAACDLLVIAGDTTPIVKLAYPQSSPEWAEQSLVVHGYLKRACDVAKQVIFILGNHEHDHGIYDYTARMARKALDIYPNLSVLDNEYADIGDYVIYGGTAWTDFNKGDAIAKITAKMYMPDYDLIHITNSKTHMPPRRLEPQDTYNTHQDWLVGLEMARLHALSLGKDLIVVTHHCPSRLSSNEARFGRGPENYAFYSDLEAQFGAQIPLWIHGHTHDSYDYTKLGTRVICNPRGYGFTKASLNKLFIPDMVIELP